MPLKPIIAVLLACLCMTPLHAQSINFGVDDGEYMNDGECDDRRFFGPGAAIDIDSDHIGRDATDCRRAYEAGTLTLWNAIVAAAITNCSAIGFGDDTSEYANDKACDDPRFEGMGSARLLLESDAGHDASDCRQLCEMGAIFLRDHSVN
ncbi:MAG: hypothetical protein AAGH70_13140 [Pseudomonadota bacterium]